MENEMELLLFKKGEAATLYTLRFVGEDESEYEKFYARFKDNAEFNNDFLTITNFIDIMTERGALERYFRPEGKMSDGLCALPPLRSKLRLYCLRLSDSILILGNGGVKRTRTYEQDDELKGYVITLQKLNAIIKEEKQRGNINISERKIETPDTLRL